MFEVNILVGLWPYRRATPGFTGTLHRRNDFYPVQAVFSIALHLNLLLTEFNRHFCIKNLILFDL